VLYYLEIFHILVYIERKKTSHFSILTLNNDLGTIFQNLIPILYADDSNLIATANSLQEIETISNNELPLLSYWLRANRLSLNIKKTQVMIFEKAKKKNRSFTPNIKIDGQTLDIVEETKMLGVIVDMELNWKKHIIYT
jgi:hypothetical protein